MLLDHGADINLKDGNGMHGIHLAAINGNCGIIEKLLDYYKEKKEKHRKLFIFSKNCRFLF